METNPKTIFHDWRTSSTKNWGTSLEAGQTLTREQIQTGALLRIADATEAMAKNHLDLIEELERSKRRYKTTLEENARLKKQVNAYKGHLRKAKEQLDNKNINIAFAEWLSENEWILRKSGTTHPNKVGMYYSHIICEYKTLEDLYIDFIKDNLNKKAKINPSVFYLHESSGKIGQFVKEVGNPKKIYIKMKSGVIYSDISNNFKKL